jgi:hypothetical protein
LRKEPAATPRLAVLPGVLGCSFDRLPATSSACDVLTSTPQPRAPAVARWHDRRHDLVTAARVLWGPAPAVGNKSESFLNHCAAAVTAALNYRERRGEGQFIDYSQVENVIRWLDWTWLYTSMTGRDRERSGNRDLAISPSSLFDCADGWVAVAAFSKEEFEGLCAAMDQPELYKKYAEPLDRLQDENAREILDAVAR